MGTNQLARFGRQSPLESRAYRLLTAEGFLCLPPYKQCPIDFIADIIDEKKW